MNFLAHLYLAGGDENLRLGAMLGDYARGNGEDLQFSDGVRKGILLHRYIDQCFDSLPQVVRLRAQFNAPFRRYSGIIIDLAFDHQLARRWSDYSAVSLPQFDLDVREMLARHRTILPEGLRSFMRYADRRGLFTTYRNEAEILFSLRCIGRRLSRANPLHRAAEIWPALRPAFRRTFTTVFPQMVQAVDEWRQQAEPEESDSS